MRFDALLEPISEDQPCGPDLDLQGDDDFINYVYAVDERVPASFFSFDRKDLDIKAEMAEIAKLLEKTRDLRLLAIEARFQALAGQITEFHECLQAMNNLLGEYWNDVHPKIEDGDPMMRRNQIELIEDIKTVILPLQFAPLFEDRRAGRIAFRDYQLAAGEKDPREDEEPGDLGTILNAVRSADNAEAVEKAYEAVKGSREMLGAIGTKCKMADSGAFAPNFDRLESALDEMIKFFEETRPDLTGEFAEGAEGVEGAEGEPGEDGAEGLAAGGSQTITIQAPGAVANQASARAALVTVEAYLYRREPSSPALIMVRQARQLIGRPLSEAIDALLPDVADQAKIDLGGETGFQMNAYKLRALADDYAEVDAIPFEEGEVGEYTANTRQEATALIAAVETFFKQTEPSSPVPVLLFKAKSYMNRDFSAIISELFAHIE